VESALPRILWLRWVKDDAGAEQAESGAPVHLALEQLEAMNVALDWSLTPVGADSGLHSSVIAA
jgi:hypothetical protein